MKDSARYPEVSIVIPTKDRTASLEICLRSLLAQDCDADRFEVVVVDDGLSGATRELVARISDRKAPRVHYLRSTSQGGNAARNTGIGFASGDPILFVDDDIYAPRSWLSSMLEGFARYPQIGCFGGPIELAFEGKAPRTCGRHPYWESDLDLGSLEKEVSIAYGANFAVRKVAFDAVGVFDERLLVGGEEVEWQERYLAAGGSIVYVPTAPVRHRRTQADLRPRKLLAKRFRRGMNMSLNYTLDPARAGQRSLPSQMLDLLRSVGHVFLRRCPIGIAHVAFSAGRAWGIIQPSIGIRERTVDKQPGRTKVCHVITRLIVGGAQENTILSCARVDGKEFESTLVCGPQTGTEGELFAEARDLGVSPIVLESLVREVSPSKDVRALFRLYRHFRRERPHVVHTHSSKAGVLGRLAAWAARVPVIVHTAHGWSWHERMHPLSRAGTKLLERIAARVTDRLIVVAESDTEKGLQARVGRRDQYVCIRSSIELDAYAVDTGGRARIRKELDIDASAPVVGSVTRLAQQKDPLTFVEAAAHVIREVPDAQFVIVGDGPLRAEVLARVRARGVENNVHLLGIRRDVPDLMQAFDVFALSSLWEGLPRVLPQAMASGVPVVATAVDGALDIVDPHVNGILVPPGDPSALAGAVTQLLQDPDRRKAMGSRGRERAAEFDLDRMIRALEEVYRTSP